LSLSTIKLQLNICSLSSNMCQVSRLIDPSRTTFNFFKIHDHWSVITRWRTTFNISFRYLVITRWRTTFNISLRNMITLWRTTFHISLRNMITLWRTTFNISLRNLITLWRTAFNISLRNLITLWRTTFNFFKMPDHPLETFNIFLETWSPFGGQHLIFL